MLNHSRTQNSPSPSMAELQFKLKRIVSSHDHMKTAFHNLKAQIKFGLLQAEDVFASLSIPLMRLVGLKNAEMIEEGRFTTIFMDAQSFQECGRNGLGSETPSRSQSSVEDAHQNHQIRNLEEESYATKVAMAGKELRERQQLQLTQLVHLLRQIETQVNSSQNDILQTLAHHRLYLQKFFQGAISYISTTHRPTQNHDSFLMITSKLLRVTFDHVSAALGSVEVGVEDLMHELAEQMCDPMVEYVKCLKTEMTTGTCSSLLATVEEMAGVMRDVRVELEDERKKVRLAENRKIEALSRLSESEERVRRMKEKLGFLLEAKNGSMEHSVPHRFLGMEEGQGKDEKPLWQPLKKKRKYQTPDSPLGAEGLLYSQPNNKRYKSTRAGPSTTHRPVTRSFSRGLGPQTPCLDSWLSLGSSPSAVNQQVLSRKHITP